MKKLKRLRNIHFCILLALLLGPPIWAVTRVYDILDDSTPPGVKLATGGLVVLAIIAVVFRKLISDLISMSSDGAIKFSLQYTLGLIWVGVALGITYFASLHIQNFLFIMQVVTLSSILALPFYVSWKVYMVRIIDLKQAGGR